MEHPGGGRLGGQRAVLQHQLLAGREVGHSVPGQLRPGAPEDKVRGEVPERLAGGDRAGVRRGDRVPVAGVLQRAARDSVLRRGGGQAEVSVLRRGVDTGHGGRHARLRAVLPGGDKSGDGASRGGVLRPVEPPAEVRAEADRLHVEHPGGGRDGGRGVLPEPSVRRRGQAEDIVPGRGAAAAEVRAVRRDILADIGARRGRGQRGLDARAVQLRRGRDEHNLPRQRGHQVHKFQARARRGEHSSLACGLRRVLRRDGGVREHVGLERAGAHGAEGRRA
ncbi:MAG: hypothetical protein DRN08_05390, partial [Thermoplasmata archaeon]